MSTKKKRMIREPRLTDLSPGDKCYVYLGNVKVPIQVTGALAGGVLVRGCDAFVLHGGTEVHGVSVYTELERRAVVQVDGDDDPMKSRYGS